MLHVAFRRNAHWSSQIQTLCVDFQSLPIRIGVLENVQGIESMGKCTSADADYQATWEVGGSSSDLGALREARS